MQSSAAAPPSREGKFDAVGLDRDVEVIMGRLLGDEEQLQIISIAGAGGIGKTTLARNVYHVPNFNDMFDILAWVTVSQDYKVGDIYASLLVSMKEFVRGEISGLSNEEMALKLHQTLMNRRFLIVIDDMWSTKSWDEIGACFHNKFDKSRIILTTRLEDVAAYADSSKNFHKMEYMADDQSLVLLKKELCKGECRLPMSKEMENIAAKIAKSCGGLPLAIAVTAGLLSEISETEADWEQIADNINLAIAADEEKYAAVLSLSYTHLPNHLRHCFLYMGAFPEDYEIHVSKLVKLWVAEGFVEATAKKSPEEVAEGFLEDLVKRNLVLVTKRKSNGKIKSCGLHDLLRDLCLIRLLEVNFLLSFMGSFFLPEIFATQLRISISHSNILSRIDGSTIHTIICYSHSSTESLNKFRLLRILDMLNTTAPTQVFELLDLRFLAFSYSTMIPASTSNLQNLQTLIIYPNNPSILVHLPVEIWKMPQLRHLISYSFHPLPHPDGSTPPLENLQTLSLVTNFVCSERMLKMIPNVKKLGICYSEEKLDEDYHLENLEHLDHLEKFKMEIRGGFNLRSSPRPVFPKLLRKLTLSGLGLPWDDLSIVGSLPNLQVLKLKKDACCGRVWETTEGEFENLEFLLIDESDLEELSTESSHFPKLRCLLLHHCPSLNAIPDDIGDIMTLELIEVVGLNKPLVESAKKIQNYQETVNENYSIQVRYSNALLTPQLRELAKAPPAVSSSSGFALRSEDVDGFDEDLSNALSVSSLSKPAPTSKAIVVGFDEDIIQIMESLTSSLRRLAVLPIVGMGGIGKSTLAKTVYDKPLIMEYFDIRAWVTTSQDDSIENLLSNLLASLKVEADRAGRYLSELAETDVYQASEAIHKYLFRRRYLIVLDDIWSMDTWHKVRKFLPDNHNGSRIILTTRLQDCAYCISHTIHIMPFLDEQQSWHLFRQKVFADQDCPLELQGVAKKIVKGCGGLPLAIVMVAGRLSEIDRTPKSWEQIGANDGQFTTILLSSYNHLPQHLRECFLYMAGFPEDYEFHVSELTKLWIAEGFFSFPDQSKVLEDVGEECVRDLVNNNLVLVASRNYDRKIKSCRLHSMVRDFCVRQAGEEKFMLPVMDYLPSPIL